MATLLLLGPIAARAGSPSYQFEVLALLGARLPGGWILRESFRPGALGEAGEVAYTAGVGSRGSYALVLDTPDVISLIAEPGVEAAAEWLFAREPGLLGGIASPVSMNRAGDLAFAADLTQEGRTGAGVFRWERATGLLAALTLPGESGPAGALWGNARPHAAINDRGQVAFAAESGDAPGGPEGVYLSTREGIRPIARPDDPAPGGGSILRAARPSLNDRSHVAFEAEVARDGERWSGILLWDESGVRALAGTGTLTSEGAVLRTARGQRQNSSGQIAFIGDTGEDAVYLAENERLVRLAGTGTPLPFGHRAQSVVASEGSLALNERGQVALLLRLEQPEATGLFIYSGGVVAAVALPGTFLAGVGPVDDLGDSVAMNDAGQLAFQAVLADGEVALILATPVLGGG